MPQSTFDLKVKEVQSHPTDHISFPVSKCICVGAWLAAYFTVSCILKYISHMIYPALVYIRFPGNQKSECL